MIFDDVILTKSATNYVADLNSTRNAKVSQVCKDAAAAMAGSIEAALRERDRVRLEDIADFKVLIDRVPILERFHLINQYALGLGSPASELLIVGQEPAYDPSDTGSFALEATGLTALWLTGGRIDIATKLSGLRAQRAFTLFPNDWYPNRPPGHTWHYVAKLVGIQRGGDFGTRAHLLEISGYPAVKQGNGRPPTEERLQFLSELLWRSEVRCVLFHGTKWRKEQFRLGASLLRVETLTEDTLDTFASIPSCSGKTAFKITGRRSGTRCVLYGKMLNGSARPNDRYMAELNMVIRKTIGGQWPGP